jgi:hypothetical protein
MTWTCYVPGCPLQGQPQDAADPQSAWREHYDREHYEPVGRSKP